MGKTCCMIGYQVIPSDKQEEVRQELEKEVKMALEDGYRTFLTEFTGDVVGMLSIQCVTEQSDQYPDIFLEAAIPHFGNYERFDRSTWEQVSKCNGIKFLCEKYQNKYPLSVTRYMMGQSSRVIIVWSGQFNHDIAYAMDYARTIELDLRIIEI